MATINNVSRKAQAGRAAELAATEAENVRRIRMAQDEFAARRVLDKVKREQAAQAADIAAEERRERALLPKSFGQRLMAPIMALLKPPRRQ